MTVPATIDSNVSGLSYAEEASPKVLPNTPTFYPLEPNSYSSFGGKVTNTSRNVINNLRQKLKGSTTDLDASGGFNSDFTQNNLQRILQGFWFANMREKASTQPLNGTQIVLTGTSGGNAYTAAAGLAALFHANDILLSSGWTNYQNNGISEVTAITDTAVTTTGAFVSEPTPGAVPKLDKVGVMFATGELSVTITGAHVTLTSTTTPFTQLGVIPGEWIFIGGDFTGAYMVDGGSNPVNRGYARVFSVTTHALVLDLTQFTAVANTGTGVTIPIFTGRVLKNEQGTSIVRRTYTLERQLGNDGTGIQSELLVGAHANQLTLNVKQSGLLDADLTFVGLDAIYRTGVAGLLSGTRAPVLDESAYNCSTDLIAQRLYLLDPTILNPGAAFAFASDVKIAINNGVTPTKAVGVLGAFDATAGDFDVSATLTAYFNTVQAIQAIRANADVGYFLIFAARNAGFILDAPLLTMGGGQLEIVKDKPVQTQLTNNMAMNTLGYTLLATFFLYVPTAGTGTP
jgi:hypothetical protein